MPAPTCSRSARCCTRWHGHAAVSGRNLGVIFKAILDGTPTSAVRLNPDLPAELERIINKALEKDRNLRYQHASDMRTDLQRLKRDTESTKIVATQASPDKTLKRRKLWDRPSRLHHRHRTGGRWRLVPAIWQDSPD